MNKKLTGFYNLLKKKKKEAFTRINYGFLSVSKLDFNVEEQS
jgi:hypothetical protein